VLVLLEQWYPPWHTLSHKELFLPIDL